MAISHHSANDSPQSRCHSVNKCVDMYATGRWEHRRMNSKCEQTLAVQTVGYLDQLGWIRGDAEKKNHILSETNNARLSLWSRHPFRLFGDHTLNCDHSHSRVSVKLIFSCGGARSQRTRPGYETAQSRSCRVQSGEKGKIENRVFSWKTDKTLA